ncbi:MAG TPA: UDP-N-acetylglucosamine 1-carboxyvinyltransferase [Myxococcaceae bacterium]|nr:UDP-N-acetylglucosamine 1-carboxyvinyltransferase [Myxococcaceae bacterium]
MDQIHVEGGTRLEGEVRVSGSKNATLPLMAAALLAEGPTTLRNVPDLADVTTLLQLLRTMGVEAERVPGAERHIVRVHAPENVVPEAPYDLVRKMRASVLVLGPLLGRFGRARVSLPGGCAIGARPIDQHLKGFRALGAEILLEGGYVEARARRLRGATVRFDKITVTGTENVLMAAVLAEGTTVLENAAREPEVEDLARALNSMGARIEGAGTDLVTVQGVTRLGGVDHAVIPDRIEAGTLLVAAAITRGDVHVQGARPDHLDALVGKLREAGCSVVPTSEGLRCKGPDVPEPVDLETTEHPGFPTDMQAQLMALLSVGSGTSVISENIFENRFMHVAELRRMGADIRVEGHTAVVKGVHTLSGAPVMATDLRASASLILAGLRATGTTRVARVYHLDRGYEALERKLQTLGARATRVK